MAGSTATARMKHHELLGLYASGWTRAALAERFGYSDGYIKQLLADPEYIEVIRGLQAMNVKKNMTEAFEVLKDSGMEAVLTIRHVMRTAPSEAVRLAAANSILDRVGISKKNVIEVNNNNVINEDAARFIMSVFDESRSESPELMMVEDSGGVFHVKEGDEEITTLSPDRDSIKGPGQDPTPMKLILGGYGGPPDD